MDDQAQNSTPDGSLLEVAQSIGNTIRDPSLVNIANDIKVITELLMELNTVLSSSHPNLGVMFRQLLKALL